MSVAVSVAGGFAGIKLGMMFPTFFVGSGGALLFYFTASYLFFLTKKKGAKVLIFKIVVSGIGLIVGISFRKQCAFFGPNIGAAILSSMGRLAVRCAYNTTGTAIGKATSRVAVIFTVVSGNIRSFSRRSMSNVKRHVSYIWHRACSLAIRACSNVGRVFSAIFRNT
ncbi:hypothetical protein DPMN_124709 [Dreissena polymorpha]|uniref:Uncharacterized protein n=1 Tax=Dreissena polymorpha TaxID=45954 RepID=A0A9D4GWI9_DREPO|nr:hypothetical protein DPMN_124709 [Dreissena polymorpha]